VTPTRIGKRFLLVILVLGRGEALGIGPDNQTLNPTLDGVVRVLFDNNLGGGVGEFVGTGSLIDNRNVNGQGWLCVLTADHVVSSDDTPSGATVKSPGIALGNSNNTTGNSAYLPAGPVFRRGPTGRVDIALLGVNYGPFSAGYTPLVRKLVAANNFSQYFSAIGYGEEGQVVAGGFQAQHRNGTQRYLNEHADFVSNYSSLGYLYNAARWRTNDPNDPMVTVKGTGATFGGDSGAPYFSNTQMHDESNDIYYLTNDQFAVHTASDRGPDFKPFGTMNYGVALDDADLQWIHDSCMAVPEPAAGTILIVLMIRLIAHRRRAYSRHDF
jgi:hypothetical protein